MVSIRQERANSEVLKALSVIVRDKINNLRLKNEIISITYCNVSADFRHCRVGFSVLSGNRNKVLEILKKSEGFIKRELMKVVKLPLTPELDFVIDVGAGNSERINQILSTLDIPEEETVDGEEI